jgi:hypothetical protein
LGGHGLPRGRRFAHDARPALLGNQEFAAAARLRKLLIELAQSSAQRVGFSALVFQLLKETLGDVGLTERALERGARQVIVPFLNG